MMHLSFLCVVLLIITTSKGASSSVPGPKCYYRQQKCCFAYKSCGFVNKKLEKKVDCPYKKCEEKCDYECRGEPQCTEENVLDGEDCTVVIGRWYGYHMECKEKYVTKKKCNYDEHCEKKCKPVCNQVAANCIKYYYYKYPKLCPTLTCGNLTISEGSDEPPTQYMAPDGELLKVEEVSHEEKNTTSK